MNLIEIGQSIMTGQMRELPADIRIRMIQAVLSATKKVAVYQNNQCTCPVCACFGVQTTQTRVYRTDGEIRYCECKRCTAKFVAIGKQKKKHRR